jgi:hypothetical protein
MKKIYLSLALSAMFCSAAWSQNVGVNTTGAAPDASAMLDVSATDKGLLAPRVALTATNAAAPVTSPATGLLVYNTATAGTAPNNVVPGYYYWTGTAWALFMISNMVTAEITSGLINIPAAVLNATNETFTPGAVDVTLTIPALAGTRGTPKVSFNADLPAGVVVAWARIISTTQVRVRFMNNSTTATTIPAGTGIYVSVVQF